MVLDGKPTYGIAEMEPKPRIVLQHDAPRWVLDHEIGHIAWALCGFDQLLAIQVPDAKIREHIEEQFMWTTLPAILSASRSVR